MVAQRQQEQLHHKTHLRCNKIPLQCQITLLLQLTFRWQCSNNRWWWCIKVPTITLIPMIIIIISSQPQVLLLLTLLETISLPSHLRQAHLVRCSSKTAIIICSSRVINKSLFSFSLSHAWFQCCLLNIYSGWYSFILTRYLLLLVTGDFLIWLYKPVKCSKSGLNSITCIERNLNESKVCVWDQKAYGSLD